MPFLAWPPSVHQPVLRIYLRSLAVQVGLWGLRDPWEPRGSWFHVSPGAHFSPFWAFPFWCWFAAAFKLHNRSLAGKRLRRAALIFLPGRCLSFVCSAGLMHRSSLGCFLQWVREEAMIGPQSFNRVGRSSLESNFRLYAYHKGESNGIVSRLNGLGLR